MSNSLQPHELSITAALTGSLPGPELLRSGACPGDIVAVSGVLGAAAAGLDLLESDHDFNALEPLGATLVERQRRPRPPLASGPRAAAAGATAAMDISDGLVRDAGRMAQASRVSLELDSIALRAIVVWMAGEGVDLAAAANLLEQNPLDWVLGGGEDHGLLATFPPDAALPSGFMRVGQVGREGNDEGPVQRVSLDGRPFPPGPGNGSPRGFDHFSR